MTLNPAPDVPPIRRRQVYYLSGFDPRGARFYHQLYRTEAALQQTVNACRYEVGRRAKSGEFVTTWTIDTHCGERHAETRFAFLGWDDLVRAHWPTSALRVIGAMPAFYRHYAAAGGFAKTLQCAPRTFWTLMLPVLYALVTLLLAGLAAAGSAWLASRWTHVAWAGLVVGLFAAAIALKLCLVGAERLRLFWLMRIFMFVLMWGRTRPAALDQRWTRFAAQIQADLAQHPADEVLIVGHSVGAMAAVAVAAQWLRLQAESATSGIAAPAPPPMTLLTLGSVIPFLGFVPEAGWFRAQVAALGDSNIAWLDHTAPHDPLCYPLVDAFAACGLPRLEGSAYRIKSARFDKMFPAADYAKLRQDAFRVHFQYLMATRLPVPNDFFHLTAGTERVVAAGYPA